MMIKNVTQRFGMVLSLFLRLYLIPFTVFKIIDAPGDVSFIPYQLWIVPNQIASLFPSYFSGAGVPIGAVLGDITLWALIVISILVRTPNLKRLGLGKKSNGYYWKPGKIPLWPIALYFAVAVPAAYSFAYEDTDFYTGRFNATLAGSGGNQKTSVTVFYTHKNHFIRDVRVLAIVFEDFWLSGKSCGNAPPQVRCGQLRGAASRYHTSDGAWLTGRGRSVANRLAGTVDGDRFPTKIRIAGFFRLPVRRCHGGTGG
jgi:hypothetical protein